MSPDGNLASLGDNLPSNALLSPNNLEDREMIRRLNLAEAERLGIPIDVPLSELDADELRAVQTLNASRIRNNIEELSQSEASIHEDMMASQQRMSGWTTLIANHAGDAPAQPNYAQNQAQFASNRQFSSIKIPKNRHLEVISEDEGAMRQLGTNQLILDQIARNTRE